MKRFDIDLLKTQQASLRHHGRLHWVHWLIISLSLVITVFAWRTSSSALEEQDKIRFEREAERVVNLMRERIKHYEDALLSGVAAMQSHDGDMSLEQWRRYSEFLNLNERYPGISGIGVIHYVDTQEIPDFLARIRQARPDFQVHPDHIYDLSLPITYIEPEATNAAAIGLDVAFEKNRRDAALYARKNGTTQISGPITLVQDAAKTPGFLFYAPYYAGHSVQSTAWDDRRRERDFRGMIYAPLVVRDLVEGVLSAGSRHVSFSISDEDTVIYEELAPEHSNVPLFTLTEEIPMHGRVWRFDIASTPAFETADVLTQPTVVLLSGICLDIMLVVLFWMMSRSNRQVLSLAEEMTDNLSQQALQLSENNRDLESFAHIVSHDLKTPIRNIHSLTELLEDELSEFMASNDSHLDIRNRLDSLRDQATKSQTLISGILEYSILGTADTPSTAADTRAMCTAIAEQLKLSPEQLTLNGEFPVLQTNRTRLQQVFANLIENAIKYNPDKAAARVEVCVAEVDGQTRFSITDNGPGIEPRFHERIFLPFTTLEAVTDIHSSGIGLSIVQRAIERQGGRIDVISDGKSGTTFQFTWPTAQNTAATAATERYA